MTLSPLTITHERLLRHLAGHGPLAHRPVALGVELGLNHKNFARDFQALETAGLIQRQPLLAITDLGRRALAALDQFATGAAPADGEALPAGYALLPLDRIAPHPLNPRKDFESDDALDALDELRESIVLAGGIRQNLEVRPADANGVHFIIAGERRWRAARAAQDEGDLPPDYRVLCLVKDVDDEQHLLDALDENFARRDLHPLDESAAFHFMRHTLDLGTAAIAEKVRRSQKHVQDYLKLQGLSEADQARMRLPADDPRALSYTAARHLLQDHRPAPPPPAAAAPSPIDRASEMLLLVEIAHACCHRPFDRPIPGSPLARATAAHHEGEYAQRVTALCYDGLLSRTAFDGERLLLLSSRGFDVLARRGLNPFTDGTALYNARQRTGMAHILIKDLERADKYVTDFLNAPRPAGVAARPVSPPPDPPPPAAAEAPRPVVTLSTDAALALAELEDKGELCKAVEVGDHWTSAAASTLAHHGFVIFARDDNGEPIATVTPAGREWLGAEGIQDESGWIKPFTLADLRREAGYQADYADGDYATPWLNRQAADAEAAPSALAELQAAAATPPPALSESDQRLADLRDAASAAFDTIAFLASMDPDDVTEATIAEVVEAANAVRARLQLALMAANAHLPRPPKIEPEEAA